RVAAVLALALGAALLARLPLAKPYESRDYWMLAQALAERGDLRAAASAYESAVRAGGDEGELLNNLALTYRAMGMRDKAEAALRRAVAVAPRLAYPHKNLGMMLIRRGSMDEALRELGTAALLDPDDAAVLGALGALHAERGERAAASAAFARALALAPSDPPLALLIAQYP